MLAKSLKPTVLALLRPLTRAIVRAGIPPNALTLAGLALSVAAAAAYAGGPLAAAGALLLAGGLFDVLDGAVARAGGRASRYGAFLDSCLDRYAEIAVLVGVLVRFGGEPLTQVAVLLAAAGSLMVSYTKARAEGLGEEVRGGLLQRPERIVLLALGAFFGLPGLRLAVWGLALLTNVTSVQRMLLVAAAMRSAGSDPGAGETPAVPGPEEDPAAGARTAVR